MNKKEHGQETDYLSHYIHLKGPQKKMKVIQTQKLDKSTKYKFIHICQTATSLY